MFRAVPKPHRLTPGAAGMSRSVAAQQPWKWLQTQCSCSCNDAGHWLGKFILSSGVAKATLEEQCAGEHMVMWVEEINMLCRWQRQRKKEKKVFYINRLERKQSGIATVVCWMCIRTLWESVQNYIYPKMHLAHIGQPDHVKVHFRFIMVLEERILLQFIGLWKKLNDSKSL